MPADLPKVTEANNGQSRNSNSVLPERNLHVLLLPRASFHLNTLWNERREGHATPGLHNAHYAELTPTLFVLHTSVPSTDRRMELETLIPLQTINHWLSICHQLDFPKICFRQFNEFGDHLEIAQN